MVVWTPAVLGVVYACVLYFVFARVQRSWAYFHMERRSRNTLIVIIIIIIITNDFNIGTTVATLPAAWPYWVNATTGWPGVSILWVGETASLIYLSARKYAKSVPEVY